MSGIGKQQLQRLRGVAPNLYAIVAGKTSQREWDRLVDLGLAAYPPNTAEARAAGAPMVNGDFACITSKGLEMLEGAGVWPVHPFENQKS